MTTDEIVKLLTYVNPHNANEVSSALDAIKAKLQAAEELVQYLDAYAARQNHDEWCSVIFARNEFKRLGGGK